MPLWEAQPHASPIFLEGREPKCQEVRDPSSFASLIKGPPGEDVQRLLLPPPQEWPEEQCLGCANAQCGAACFQEVERLGCLMEHSKLYVGGIWEQYQNGSTPRLRYPRATPTQAHKLFLEEVRSSHHTVSGEQNFCGLAENTSVSRAEKISLSMLAVAHCPCKLGLIP